MPLSKADIDALVTNMASRNFNPTAAWDALRKALYLAAGLTAEGERKPERVRCWSYLDSRGQGPYISMSDPDMHVERPSKVTPGWFVPSEEGE